jgi:hypothetical protein
MKVAQITKAQARELKDKTFDGVQKFAPQEDANGKWYISKQEVEQCTTVEWVKSLKVELEYNPKKVQI